MWHQVAAALAKARSVGTPRHLQHPPEPGPALLHIGPTLCSYNHHAPTCTIAHKMPGCNRCPNSCTGVVAASTVHAPSGACLADTCSPQSELLASCGSCKNGLHVHVRPATWLSPRPSVQTRPQQQLPRQHGFFRFTSSGCTVMKGGGTNGLLNSVSAAMQPCGGGAWLLTPSARCELHRGIPSRLHFCIGAIPWMNVDTVCFPLGTTPRHLPTRGRCAAVACKLMEQALRSRHSRCLVG